MESAHVQRTGDRPPDDRGISILDFEAIQVLCGCSSGSSPGQLAWARSHRGRASNRASVKRRRERNRSIGLCSLCGQPRDPGSSQYCSYHFEYMREYMREYQRTPQYREWENEYRAAKRAAGLCVVSGCACPTTHKLCAGHAVTPGQLHRNPWAHVAFIGAG